MAYTDDMRRIRQDYPGADIVEMYDIFKLRLMERIRKKRAKGYVEIGGISEVGNGQITYRQIMYRK